MFVFPPPLSTTHPAQKLFSELIREAHIPLQRCKLLDDQSQETWNQPIRTQNSATSRAQRETLVEWNEEQQNEGKGKACQEVSEKAAISTGSLDSQISHTPLKLQNSQNFKDPQKPQNSQNSSNSQKSQIPPLSQSSQNSQMPLKSRNSKDPQNSQSSQILLKSQNSQNPQNSQKSQDLQNCSPERPRQRQQPGPLPALALFLKQHSVRPRRTRNQKPDPLTGQPFLSHPSLPDAANERPPQCSSPDPETAKIPGLAAVAVQPSTGSSGPGPGELETTLTLTSSASATSVSSTSLAVAVGHPCLSPLLPDPQSPTFGFESLSPPSSPEPLTSFALPLDPAPKAPPAKETVSTSACSGGGGCSSAAPPSSSSSSSVFQWHTVLPPAEPYLQELASSCTAPAPTLQDPDQPLGFPGDLSPLALPLSPTFSSLDGDVLSPTPSLTDLVTFFSNSEDLEMGMEFPTAVPPAAPPPGMLEDDVDVSRHVPSLPPPPLAPSAPLRSSPPTTPPCPPPSSPPPPMPSARKHYITKKKKKKRRTTKITRTDQDSSYTSRHPNLEEVEEQLFISFTSKVRACFSCTSFSFF